MLRALEWICIVLALQGLSWVVLGTFDPLGIWSGLAAESLYGASALPDDALPLSRLLHVLLGATDAAFFVLLYGLVHDGVRGGHAWAHRWSVAGVLTWFTVDTAGSLALGATFNVVMVNIPALALVGVPLWWLRNTGASNSA